MTSKQLAAKGIKFAFAFEGVAYLGDKETTDLIRGMHKAMYGNGLIEDLIGEMLPGVEALLDARLKAGRVVLMNELEG